MSNLVTTNVNGENIDSGTVKAWAVWDSVTTSTLTDSYNISSLTDIAVGRTELNYSSSFSNSTYSTGGTGGYASGNPHYIFIQTLASKTTSKTEFAGSTQAGGLSDTTYSSVMVNGDLA